MRSWEFIDKSTWGPGPWQEEHCDKLQWTDRVTGLPCLAVRSPHLGNWCGYVGVAHGHPAYEQHYDGVEVEVHGGLTYAAHCRTDDREHGVCHVTEPGEPDDVWWLGFDCGHFLDYVPAMASRESLRGWSPLEDLTNYKDVEYVLEECRQLAKQLAAFE